MKKKNIYTVSKRMGQPDFQSLAAALKPNNRPTGEVDIYRTILEGLPQVIVVASPICAPTVPIKGIARLSDGIEYYRLPKRARIKNTLYFYFQENGIAYVDRNHSHFFNNKRKRLPKYKGPWQKVLVKVAKEIQKSQIYSTASDPQKYLLHEITR